MNLNNKYLAIGLSIAAVAIVSYQLFINKPDTNVRRAAPPPGSSAALTPIPSHTPAPRTTLSTTPNTPVPTSDSSPMIDYNSPALLTRIPPEMAEKLPRQEIPKEFGLPIFSRGITPKTKPQAPQPTREVEYVLNAIIIDQNRQIAIINDTIVKVDDTIAGAKVVSIVKSKVILKINSKLIELSTNSRIKRVQLIGGQGENQE